VFLERGVRAFLPSWSFGGPFVLGFSLPFCATKQVRDQLLGQKLFKRKAIEFLQRAYILVYPSQFTIMQM